MEPAADVVLTGVDDEFSSSELDIIRELDADLPPIECDPIQVRKVLINLVQNAVQAMPSGGTLTLRTRSNNGDAIVSISDTGDGISPTDRARIFNPFFTTRVNGTGLGLAIAHKVIRAHGGEILVTSNPGSGTTFDIVLPVEIAPEVTRTNVVLEPNEGDR